MRLIDRLYRCVSSFLLEVPFQTRNSDTSTNTTIYRFHQGHEPTKCSRTSPRPPLGTPHFTTYHTTARTTTTTIIRTPLPSTTPPHTPRIPRPRLRLLPPIPLHPRRSLSVPLHLLVLVSILTLFHPLSRNRTPPLPPHTTLHPSKPPTPLPPPQIRRPNILVNEHKRRSSILRLERCDSGVQCRGCAFTGLEWIAGEAGC